MAITLAQITGDAGTVALQSALAAEESKLICLSTRELKAISIIALNSVQVGRGGSTYATNWSSLMQHAEYAYPTPGSPAAGSPATKANVRRATVAYWQVASHYDGIETDLETLMATSKELREYPEATLDKAIFLLIYLIALNV